MWTAKSYFFIIINGLLRYHDVIVANQDHCLKVTKLAMYQQLCNFGQLTEKVELSNQISFLKHMLHSVFKP